MAGVIASVALQLDAKQPNQQLKGVTQQSRKTEKAVEALNGGMRNAGGQFVKTGDAARSAANGTGAFAGKINLLSAALKAVPLIGAGEAIRRFVKGFSEADKAAAAVRTLGVDSEQLRGRLLGVSNEVKGLVSQTELLAASYNVASAGFNDAASAADILKASSFGAVGGLSDLNTVADATTSVLNAYGLSSDQAAKIVDGFIQTQNDGKIIVAQYAAQIGRVAPIAAAAGVGVEELNAAISAVTATGVPVESTFAGIRQAIASVIKPTKEAKDTADLLGIEFSSAAIKAKGFGGFLEEVIKKTGGSEVALTKLFGSVEAVATILPLANDNLTKFNTSLENQKNATGAAEQATDDLGSTVSAQTTSIVNNIGNVARGLDTVLGPALKRILGTLNEIISAASKAVAKLGDLVTGELERASATFQGLSTILLQSEGGLNSIKTAVEGLNPSISGTVNELDRMSGALNRADLATRRVSANAPDSMIKLAMATQTAISAQKRLIAERRKVLEAAPKAETTAEDPALAALRAQLEAQLAGEEASKPSGRTKKTKEAIDAFTKFAQSGLDPILKADEAFGKVLTKMALANELSQARLDGTEQEEERRQRINEILDRTGIKGAERREQARQTLGVLIDQEEALKSQQKEQDKLKEKARQTAQELANFYTSIGDSIKTGIVDSLTAAVDETKSLADVASNVLRNIANILLNFGVNTAFSALGSGGGFLGKLFGGARANGGPVSPNRSFLVGERGPELFVPRSSGNIVPNHAMGSANVTVNVDASGSSVEGDSNQAGQLGKMLGAAVQAELIKQKRPGGLLAT